MTSPHDILGVPFNASEKEIRMAYKKKAKLLHPDVNKAPDAHAQFLLLKKAYEILTNPVERAEFYQPGYTDPLEVYLQKIEAIKAKIRAEEKLKEEAFQLKKEKFRLSPYYKSSKIFLKIGVVLIYLLCIALLMTCLYLMINVHSLLIFILLPFISLAIFIIKSTNEWYKKMMRYFL